MWSTPAIRPLAIDGAAPEHDHEQIAASFSPKSRIASGNQAIDGMVCRPVISDADGGAQHLRRATTASPSSAPMTSASAKPMKARRSVVADGLPAARRLARCRRQSRRAPPAGPAGRSRAASRDHTTSCQTSRAMPMAASLGQAADQIRPAERGGRCVGQLQRVEARELVGQLRALGERSLGGLSHWPWRRTSSRSRR